MAEIIRTVDLTIGYKKSGMEKVIIELINLSLKEGEFVCMIGQNGSGKTTLLKTIAGVHPPIGGKVVICEKNMDEYKGSELARTLSVVLTDRISVSNLNVYTLVALGRYPYTNWIGGLSKVDEEKVIWALENTHTLQFAQRKLTELSDGELQKVLIARALAQDTNVILLDEPTAHLDLPNRIEIFELLRKLARETGKGVLLSTHELDLALHLSDKIWLIQILSSPDSKEELRNKIISGVPEDLVLNGSFERAFENRGLIFDKVNGRFKIPFRRKKSIHLTGEDIICYWTSVALEREGFEVNNSTDSEIKIEADSEKQEWKIKYLQTELVVPSVELLLLELKNLFSKENQ